MKNLQQREKPELIAIIQHFNDYRDEYIAFSVILMGCIDGLDSCFAGEEDNQEMRLRVLRTLFAIYRYWMVVLAPLHRQIECAADESMSSGRHIREKDTGLAVLDLADGASVLHLAEQSLKYFRELDDIFYSADSLGLLGLICMEHGELETARALLEESRAINKQFGLEIDVLHLVPGLARLSVRDGDLAAARRLYQESLALLFESNVHKENIAASLEGLAALEAGQGVPGLTVRLWGVAEALREAIGAPIHPVYRASYEQARAQARATLGEQVFRMAWAEGRPRTPEQALAAHEAPEEATSMPQLYSALQSPLYPAGLTAREVEVLRLLAQGWTDAQITEHLVISPRTVNRHTTSLYSKLNVSSRAAATRYALKHHLL